LIDLQFPPDDEPPDERFWVKYSPHHELPVSSASSLTLHVLIIGLVILIGYMLSQSRQQQSQPVQQDAVEIAGGGGLEGDSLGTGTGGKTVGERTEQVANSSPRGKSEVQSSQPSADLKLPEASKTPLDVPKSTESTEPYESAISGLSELEKAVREDFDRQTKAVAARAAAKASKSGGRDGLSKGSGGGTGGGRDGGIGKGVGPGGGTGGPGSRLLTRQQRREMRWRIDFSGDPAEHIRKLKALHIALAVPTRQQGMFLLIDLTQTPPAPRKDNLASWVDKVKWFNKHPPSLQGMMQQLRLPELPQYAVIFLPDDMEQEMLRLEEAYAGRREDQIQLTEFVIERHADGYRPKVVNQIPRTR
jgi:hypothetical protein